MRDEGQPARARPAFSLGTASRRGAWHELLAATLATTALAAPMLVLAASVEVWVWPHLLRWASPVA